MNVNFSKQNQSPNIEDFETNEKPTLLDGEEMIMISQEIYFYLTSSLGSGGWSPERYVMTDQSTPSWSGRLVLTNQRLILLHKWNNYRFSFPGIIALSERFVSPNKNWPYQAIMFLSGGLFLIVETPKDNIVAREKDLVPLLNRAIVMFGKGEGDSSYLGNAKGYQWQEEKRRA
jgi:hypothetical protein